MLRILGILVLLNNLVRILSPSDTLQPFADAIVEMTPTVIASSKFPIKLITQSKALLEHVSMITVTITLATDTC